MSFERQRRVATFWGWLPAFRAAAEFESIQRASLAMGVSASAVSRAIKSLERALGFQVFERQTSGVVLTTRGRALLDATRLGMRTVDDVLDPLEPEAARLGAQSPFLPLLAARALPEKGWSTLVPIERAAAPGPLLRGEVDVLLTHEASDDARIASLPLAPLRMVRARGRGAKSPVAVTRAEVLSGHGDAGTLLELVRRGRLEAEVPEVLLPEGMKGEPLPEALPVYALVRRSGGEAGPAWLTLLEALR